MVSLEVLRLSERDTHTLLVQVVHGMGFYIFSVCSGWGKEAEAAGSVLALRMRMIIQLRVLVVVADCC